MELQPKLRVVYLDELIINQNLPISLGIVQLVVDSQEEAIEKTPRLLQRVREEIADLRLREKNPRLDRNCIGIQIYGS